MSKLQIARIIREVKDKLRGVATHIHSNDCIYCHERDLLHWLLDLLEEAEQE